MSDFLPDYWNAPIFYPAEGTFAFSEPQPLAGFLLLPLKELGPAQLYNNLFFLYMTANGLSAFLLLRYTQVSHLLAFLGGLWVQALPFLTHERGVIQLQAAFPFLLALMAAIHLLRKPKFSNSLLLALSVAVAFYLSENYGLILSIALIPFGLFSLRVSPKAAHLFAIAGFFALLFAFPLIYPQVGILAESDFARSERSIGAGSASLLDYLSPSKRILSSSLGLFEDSKFGLYPGFGLLALGLFGALRLGKMENTKSYSPALLVSFLLCFLLTLGLSLELLGWQPYEWIVSRIAGFNHLRSPFRFGIWLQLCLIFSAIHFLNTLEIRKYYWPILFVVLFSIIEIFPLPARVAAVPPAQSIEGVQSPAVFLPYAQGTSAAAYTQTTRYMLIAQASGIRLVNGYSGYLPRENAELKKKLAGFPDQSSLDALQGIGTKSILVFEGWLLPERKMQLDNLIEIGEINFLNEQSGYLLFELAPSFE